MKMWSARVNIVEPLSAFCRPLPLRAIWVHKGAGSVLCYSKVYFPTQPFFLMERLLGKSIASSINKSVDIPTNRA